MSDVVQFPDAEAREVRHMTHLNVSANAPVVDVDKLHAEAFEEIEGDIVDVDRMAEITRDLIMNCSAAHDEKELHNLGLATFAVFQMAKMTADLRKKYQALWDGEWVRP